MKRARAEVKNLVRIYDTSTQQAEKANKRAKQARKDLIKHLREDLQREYKQRLHLKDNENQFKDYIEEIEKFWGCGIYFPDWTFEFKEDEIQINAAASGTMFFLPLTGKQFAFEARGPKDKTIAQDLNKRVCFFRWLHDLRLGSKFSREFQNAGLNPLGYAFKHFQIL